MKRKVRYLGSRKVKKNFFRKTRCAEFHTSHNDIPHVTPVTYIYENDFLFFATDYDTRKYKNLQVNRNVALAVDIYNSSVENKAVVVQGTAEIIEKGERIYKSI